MNILIIGVKGFIGSYIYNYFLDKGVNICWGCDVIPDYTNNNYFRIDSSNADFHDVFEFLQFDVCINCSGASNVPDSLTHPQRDFTLNTYNVFRLLDTIRKYNSECKFINLSSAAVYGNPAILPIKETLPPCPISPYGLHKLMSESICKEFSQFYDLKTCSLRIFSAYGEGLRKQLLWDLYSKMQSSSVVQLFGDGTETRDFIYIHDIACAIELIIQNADFKGESINVANGVEIKIRDLVECFCKQANWTGEINFIGSKRKGDPNNWRADISILQSYKYSPSTSIDSGIKKYIQWARENA
ncbi:NAD-dependent epimerase/dehydratase family protein [Spirosoma harenae]